MKRTLRRPPGTTLRAILGLVMLAFASSLTVAPAAAGIRDMVKSAKDKAGQKVGQKSGAGTASCDQVEFTNVVIEITGERLDKFIAGLEASAPIQGEQGKLILRRDQVQAQISEIHDKHGEAVAEARQKRDEHAQCVRDAIEESRRQRMQADQARIMANPASGEKLLKAIARLNDAQIKGDKAEELKAQAELDALMRATPADTLAAWQKCGPGPTPHPQAARLATLEQESTSIDERIRDLDMKARKLESETSGLTQEQFAMVRERTERFVASADAHTGGYCFTAAEREVLVARKAALKKALGV